MSNALQRQMGDTGVSNKKQRRTWVGRDYVSEGYGGVVQTKGSTGCPGAGGRGFSMGARPRLRGAGWEGQVGGGWCDLIAGQMHHPWTVSG